MLLKKRQFRAFSEFVIFTMVHHVSLSHRHAFIYAYCIKDASAAFPPHDWQDR